MGLSNKLTEKLSITHPIIQAPMGGESTPDMAIAVSNAGGLGGLGCSFMTAPEIIENVKLVKSGTTQPFNLNFFAHQSPTIDEEIHAKTSERLEAIYTDLGITNAPKNMEVACDTFTEEHCALMLELRPKIVSFHFGLPPSDMLRALREAGIKIMCSATTVAEAKSLDRADVDVIIAQGWEAGGHRGTFDMTYEDFGVGTMALVPQIVDAVDKPVIASGGIADGRGIAAAMILGAEGVQMGTAFLSCPEANITEGYRQSLRVARDDDTRLTRAFSGRPARARTNKYIESMAESRFEHPEFPLMYNFTDPLIETCAEGYEFELYGQAAALNRELPAADLVQLLVDETSALLGNFKL